MTLLSAANLQYRAISFVFAPSTPTPTPPTDSSNVVANKRQVSPVQWKLVNKLTTGWKKQQCLQCGEFRYQKLGKNNEGVPFSHLEKFQFQADTSVRKKEHAAVYERYGSMPTTKKHQKQLNQ